ncbi:myosin-IIIb [Pelecanus crispus]|uniref:myosin-IIIb n=1 Tax=Pelecanus crispus TaxID=36300 RepID=UPI003F5D4B36
MVSLGELRPPSGAAGDLAALAELDEAALLGGLRERFLRQQVYTAVGDILIAMNPFQPLPLYGREVSERYRHHETGTLPPHIFAVASRAYHAMLGRRGGGPQSQCIVISGESGAGKTESTKLLLQHIMNLCKSNSQLEQQILQVNPLLEAFGNAQTVMNDNSSRFGKYIQLRFQKNTVRGAKLSEYLLEKSRVVQQDTGERNFHIFYYMFAGLSSEEKEMYGLLDPSLYRYISGRFGTQDVAQHWKHKYQEVCNALDMVGFQEQEQVDMQAILAGVLSLGNVTFEPEESTGSVKGQFGVQEDELLKCLICTMSVTRGEQIQRFHTQQQAEDARDSIAKVAYGRVFGWIVCKINELLAENVDPEVELREIGILDIFGFENFAVNRFEQLCINLANEQLQHFFNHHIFQLEQAAYKEEGLPWETITFKNNEPVLNLLLAKPLGLLSLLDEQSAFPQATDKTFVDKLNSTFKGNLNFQPGRGHVLGFSIIHYAGKVQYTAGGFLEKNRDTLPANIRGLFINSVTPLLSLLFTGKSLCYDRVIPGAADKFNSTRKQSAGAQFRHSLMVLMERMYSSSPHFVRCIKPNSQKQPGMVDNQVLLLQLRYNGLLETIRIRRNGFSWRPSFKEFAERFVKTSECSLLDIVREATQGSNSPPLLFHFPSPSFLPWSIVTDSENEAGSHDFSLNIGTRNSWQSMWSDWKEQQLSYRKMTERQADAMSMSRPCGVRVLIADAHLLSAHPQSGRAISFTPFDNFLDPSAPRPVLGTEEQTGEEAKMRRLKRGATLRWFKETQAQKVMQDDGAFPSWLHGMISRREAENLLTDKPLGCFLVRISQSRPGYTLTYRGEGRCRHYMIEMQPNARYVILGEDRAHASLTELIWYHQTVGIQPFMEILTVPCGQKSSESLDYEDPECLGLGPPAAKGETPPEEQLRASSPSTSEPTLQSGAATVRRCMWFRRTKNCQNQQSLDKSSTKPSSGKERGSQRAFPRLHASIRLAMQEIQQVKLAQSYPLPVLLGLD